MAKRYWLMKSEPDVYSFDDLRRDKTTPWDGVRKNRDTGVFEATA